MKFPKYKVARFIIKLIDNDYFGTEQAIINKKREFYNKIPEKFYSKITIVDEGFRGFTTTIPWSKKLRDKYF